jgi:hypothetical protein
MYSAHATGKLGERIVFELLTGSEWNNEINESRDYYDLLWEGIKIEVKTTRCKLRNGFQVSLRASQTGNTDVVFVVVGLDEDKRYYWVILNPRVHSSYVKLQDSIPVENLKQTIKDCFGSPYWNKEKRRKKNELV